MSALPEPPEPLLLALPDAVLDVIAERVSSRISVPAAEPWVGVAEAAQHLGCRPQRIYDLISRRAATGIPHHKEGARVLFKRSELDAWIQSGRAA